MRTIVFTIIIFAIIIFSTCQSTPNTLAPTTELSDKFPEDWLGTWAGMLIISKPGEDTMQVPMQLYCAENDTLTNGWDWHIIYGADTKAGRRAYTLHTRDAAKGHYAIDEHNGIILDAHLLGGTLYSRFAVSGNILTTMTRKVGESMIFEVISGKQTPVNITGNIKDIPEVQSFNISVQQRAILSRVQIREKAVNSQ